MGFMFCDLYASLCRGYKFENLPSLTSVLSGDPLNSSVYLFEMMLNLPFKFRSVMFPVLNQY